MAERDRDARMSDTRRLVRHLYAVKDAPLREALWRRIAGSADLDSLAEAMEMALERAERGLVPERVARLVWSCWALDPAADAEVARLRERAAIGDCPRLDALVRGGEPLSIPPAAFDAPEPRPTGTLTTLGGRKWLARRPGRQIVLALARETSAEVLERLLENPSLTERDLVRAVAKRPGSLALIRAAAQATRWLRSERVRAAIVLHPRTPLELSLPLVPLLSRTDRVRVKNAPDLPEDVRRRARESLARGSKLPPPTEAASSSERSGQR